MAVSCPLCEASGFGDRLRRIGDNFQIFIYRFHVSHICPGLVGGSTHRPRMIGSIIIIIFLSQNTSIQNQETIIHHNYHTIPSSSSMKQQLLTSLALLAFLLTPSATAFVEPKSTAHSRKHSMPPLHSWLTNPHRSFLRRQPSSYDERRRIRQEIPI